MKRDWDLVRSILIALEEQEPDEALEPESVKEWDLPTVGYHMLIMREAGLVSGGAWSLCGLTWSGYELLAPIRDQWTWDQIKMIANQKRIGLFTESVVMIASLVDQGRRPSIELQLG